MAAIDELIEQIDNPTLRERIAAEVRRMAKQKKFGLVFEEHLPERTLLYEVPVQRGSLVARNGNAKDVYQVIEINGGTAECFSRTDKQTVELPVSELTCVAEFGEPIYPYLEPLDSVENAPDSGLWHTLIEADNYHALQLLGYMYHGKVDCIYIDPPYNTGARDWKYNNDYVDGNDQYRHSKWLSMMKKRLKLAKKLLSDNGAIFISIDDNEQAHLRILCDDIFGVNNFVACISNVNNPKGRSDQKYVATAHEYILIYKISEKLQTSGFAPEEKITKRYNKIDDNGKKWREIDLRKTGDNDLRADRPNMFYPFYWDKENKKLLLNPFEGSMKIVPMKDTATEGRWRWEKATAKNNLSRLYARYMPTKKQWSIFEMDYFDENERIKATSAWTYKDVNSERGTEIFQKYLGFPKNSFPNPKPLGTIKRILEIATAHNPNALVLDFFAGSGTTLHAVNLLNAEDGGHRRCIMVTNNEVSDAEAKSLAKHGHKPGDDEWNKLGIARYVTWPRTVCSIEGHDINGQPLKGSYLGGDRPMSVGFPANANFFKLGFLDKDSVSRGKQLEKLIPVLWMKAGGYGKCPSRAVNDEYMLFPENGFAVLANTKYASKFRQELSDDAKVIYIVTDYEPEYHDIANSLGERTTYQLYRDYLDNFTINMGRT